MKAFLNRFNRGLSSKDKEKDKEKDRDNSSILTKDRSDNSSTNSHSSPSREKRELVQLPPLPGWPPPHVQSENRLSIEPLTRHPTPSSTQIQRSNSAGTVNTSTGTPTSTSSHKPLPDICARPLPPIEEPCDDDSGVGLTITSTTPTLSQDPEPSARRKANTSATTVGTDVQKKVAFLSPPPTPSALNTQLPDPSVPSPSPIAQTLSGSGAPLKTSVSRFQATHGKDTRGSISTAASSSRTDLAIKSTTTTTTVSSTSGTSTAVAPVPSTHTAKATSTRTAVSPYPGSMRSTTPYSQMSNASSRILAVTSWSEGAEEDLVSNLGPRERTRQEVLWEIVASEERCAASPSS